MKKRTILACLSSLMILGSLCACEQEVEGNEFLGTTFFVSPDGTSLNDGLTMETPTALSKALVNAKPGDRVLLLDGTYEFRTSIKVEEASGHVNGTKEQPILVRSYSSDPSKVVLDYSRQPFNTSYRGFTLNMDYWQLKYITVKGAGDNGIYVGGNNNLVEGCITTECKDSGIQLGRKGSGDTEVATWPSYNTILNCTSFNNSDPKGEDADGFACKLTTGVGNVFDGCIAYNNIDDGWDLYAKSDTGAIGAVTIRNCVAFNNGVRNDGFGSPNSDGNGFKLGGEGVPNQHIVENCIAFNNLAHGFTDNSNPGTLMLKNCTAFDNGTRDIECNNFDLARDGNSYNYAINLLSYCTNHSSKDQFRGSIEYSSLFIGYSSIKFEELQYAYTEDVDNRGERFIPSAEPFLSVEAPDALSDIHKLLRNPDGSVNLGDFLKVNPNSEFTTMGKNGVQLGANLHEMKGAK